MSKIENPPIRFSSQFCPAILLRCSSAYATQRLIGLIISELSSTLFYHQFSDKWTFWYRWNQQIFSVYFHSAATRLILGPLFFTYFYNRRFLQVRWRDLNSTNTCRHRLVQWSWVIDLRRLYADWRYRWPCRRWATTPLPGHLKSALSGHGELHRLDNSLLGWSRLLDILVDMWNCSTCHLAVLAETAEWCCYHCWPSERRPVQMRRWWTGHTARRRADCLSQCIVSYILLDSFEFYP